MMFRVVPVGNGIFRIITLRLRPISSILAQLRSFSKKEQNRQVFYIIIFYLYVFPPPPINLFIVIPVILDNL